jgi:hypothetical protein
MLARVSSSVLIWKEGFMAALEIRKDRTPAVLRKLAKETGNAPSRWSYLRENRGNAAVP